MPPKKNTKPTLKKAGTMAATAAAGQEYLKKAWGTAKLNQINARASSTSSSDDEAPTTSSKTTSVKKAPTKPKLTKTQTMKTTTKEAKKILGKQVLGDTRAETKRRQAAVNAKNVLQAVAKPTVARKANLKRLGTMANTAREGKAYIQRTVGTKRTTGRKRTGGRNKK